MRRRNIHTKTYEAEGEKLIKRISEKGQKDRVQNSKLRYGEEKDKACGRQNKLEQTRPWETRENVERLFYKSWREEIQIGRERSTERTEALWRDSVLVWDDNFITLCRLFKPSSSNHVVNRLLQLHYSRCNSSYRLVSSDCSALQFTHTSHKCTHIIFFHSPTFSRFNNGYYVSHHRHIVQVVFCLQSIILSLWMSLSWNKPERLEWSLPKSELHSASYTNR